MIKRLTIITVGLCVVIFSGCRPAAESPRGFRLPSGNAEIGATAFTAHRCHGCHRVVGESLPEIEPELVGVVELGGDVARVQTYGDLVSSIINPSHRLATGYPAELITDGNGVSRMPNYNEVMTVQDLIDLVAYLQPKYKVSVPTFVYRPYAM